MRLRGVVLALGIVSCSGEERQPTSTAGACTDVELIVAASNYRGSSVICGAPGCVANPRTSGIDLGGDPQLSMTNGRAFFLARDNDLLFEVDSKCGVPISKFSVHDLAAPALAANPHDAAAAADGTVFVPLYAAPRVAFVRDGKIEGSLDLSPYDTDGNPQAEAIRIVKVGGVEKAFVSLERLDDKDLLRSKQTSQMLRIDVASRSVEAAIDLAGRNPFNVMAELGSGLYLSEPGNFDAADDELAGIELFDTTTSTSRILVGERTIGASVAEVVVAEGCGVAIVAGPEPGVNPTSLVSFDPTDGRIIASLSTPLMGPTPNYDLQGLAWRGRTLFVGDRRLGGSGFPVHVLEDRGGCALVDTGRTIDLPQRAVALRAAQPR